MNIAGKYHSVKNKLHLTATRFKNRNSQFIYHGDILSPKINILCSKIHIMKYAAGGSLLQFVIREFHKTVSIR